METIIMKYKLQIILIIVLMVSVLFFVMCDLWAGVRKSKKRGECSVSYGLRKTVEKTCRYYNYMLILLGIDLIQMLTLHTLNHENNYSFWIIPLFTIFGAIFIGFIEVKSVFEKEEVKDRAKMKEAALFALRSAELLKDKEFLEAALKILEKEQNSKCDEQL